jgi:hypothetical protein
MKKSLLLAAVAAFVAVATVSAFADMKVDGKIMGKVKAGNANAWANGDTGFDLNFDSDAATAWKDFSISYRMQDATTLTSTNTYIVGGAGVYGELYNLTSPGSFKLAMEGRTGAGALNWNVTLIPWVMGTSYDVKDVSTTTNLGSTSGSLVTIKPKVTFILSDVLTIATRPFGDTDDPLEITMGGASTDTKDLVSGVGITNLDSMTKSFINVGAKASADLNSMGLPVTAGAYFAYISDSQSSDLKVNRGGFGQLTNVATTATTRMRFKVNGDYKLAITPDLYVKPSASLELKGDPQTVEQTVKGNYETNSYKNNPGLINTIGLYAEVGYLGKITGNMGVEIVTSSAVAESIYTMSGGVNASNNNTRENSSTGWSATYMTFGGTATGGEFTVGITGKVKMSYTLAQSDKLYLTNGSADKGPISTTSNSTSGMSFNNAQTGGDTGTLTINYKSAETNNWIFQGNYANLTIMSGGDTEPIDDVIGGKNAAPTQQSYDGFGNVIAGMDIRPSGTKNSVIELGKTVGAFTFATKKYGADLGAMFAMGWNGDTPMEFTVGYAAGPVSMSIAAWTYAGLNAINPFALMTGDSGANTFGNFTAINATASFTF